ncbi:CIC11C00000000085 [Sungouiella intermedia]|uniref:Golgi SNAP receptor complex member 1 n=1 Tax=Sungouiella intermedia TaxID=45354 RepID=A0A1L0BXA9_9ASCO|nr:CIC11C00000001829 [[Candida] intermedia]SGZ55985.1 CIC11C00000000085 [[Candida] intermedia]
MSSATFTQTRNSALSLEKQTEVLLVRYSKLQLVGNSIEANDDESSLVAQISDLLQKREEVIGNLNRISEVDATISTSKLQQLQRHREILAEHRSSFLKMQTKITDERNRNNLLFLIQSDISAHKQRNVSSAATNEDDYILDERRRVDTANSFADRLLQLAYETRDELMGQRQYLQNATSRIQGTLQSIPGINVLVSRINTRRKRDTLIMGFVIAFCIIGLFFFA